MILQVLSSNICIFVHTPAKPFPSPPPPSPGRGWFPVTPGGAETPPSPAACSASLGGRRDQGGRPHVSLSDTLGGRHTRHWGLWWAPEMWRGTWHQPPLVCAPNSAFVDTIPHLFLSCFKRLFNYIASLSVISFGTWEVFSSDSIDSCLPWQFACSWCRSLSWQCWCCCCYHCYRCCCYYGYCCCCWRCWQDSSQHWSGKGRVQQIQWMRAVNRKSMFLTKKK